MSSIILNQHTTREELFQYLREEFNIEPKPSVSTKQLWRLIALKAVEKNNKKQFYFR